MAPLQQWQMVLAAVLGVFALCTAGLPLVLWWWHLQSSGDHAQQDHTEERA